MKRPTGVTVVAIIVFLLGVNAYAEVVRVLLGWNQNPPVLVLWQLEIGTLAMFAAGATWLVKRLAPALIVLYGISTGLMIVALQPILDLPVDALSGLITSGAIVLVVSFALARYVQRALRQGNPTVHREMPD